MKQGIRRAVASVLAAVVAVGLVATPASADESKQTLELRNASGKLYATVKVKWTYNYVYTDEGGVPRYDGDYEGTIVNKVPNTHNVTVEFRASKGGNYGFLKPKNGSFSGSYYRLFGAYFEACMRDKSAPHKRICKSTR
ncbi:hypothetical protein GCM10022247_71940 [Allokutzneria multivorans]|uniref:Uncharacterized protein n=1 Tax=Allokutzneria multivorans TaxID=1142134 RepID=A0ABP7U4L0_9PSEU